MIGLKLPSFCFSVRVRYAPSPTGPMHLGAVRTALANYLFAQKHSGKFILRIEDTDFKRNQSNGVEEICNTLKWLNISPHESPQKQAKFGPYLQSQRIHIYKRFEKELIAMGVAYPCFCDEVRELGSDNSYDRRCRQLPVEDSAQRIKNGDKYAVRIKSDIPELSIHEFEDTIFGKVPASPFDDFVIVKSNGWPTYHFANVVDDWQMQITHVIRGAEWLTSTPKHIYLYKLMGVSKIPAFLHLPLVMTPEGKKLSKRDPTTPINYFREKGYLSEAIVNYAGLLGMHFEPPLKQEFHSLKELSQLFEPSKLNSSPIKSDIKKINFFNRHYIKEKWKSKDKDFLCLLYDRLRHYHHLEVEAVSNEYLSQVLECVIDRINSLEQLSRFAYFFTPVDLTDPQTLNDMQKIFGKSTSLAVTNEQLTMHNFNPELFMKNCRILNNLLLIFNHVISEEEYGETAIAKSISEFLYDNREELQNEDVFHLLRLAVIGRKSGPNIVRICALFGKQRIISSLLRFKAILMPVKQPIDQQINS